MLRFDFDVVSDPLPPKRIPARPRPQGAADQQDESGTPAPAGDGDPALPTSEDAR